MDRKKRICFACGKVYRFCPQCAEDQGKPVWMCTWDTEECKTVFKIVSNYCSDLISKSEAKNLLSGVLTHTVTFNEEIEEKIKEILHEDKPQVQPSHNQNKKYKKSYSDRNLS